MIFFCIYICMYICIYVYIYIYIYSERERETMFLIMALLEETREGGKKRRELVNEVEINHIYVRTRHNKMH
jgi:hypothetical protein